MHLKKIIILLALLFNLVPFITHKGSLATPGSLWAQEYLSSEINGGDLPDVPITCDDPCSSHCSNYIKPSSYYDYTSGCIYYVDCKGITPVCPPLDCNNDPNGSAYYDDCGYCVGGSTGQSACVPQPDCAGVIGGSAYYDNCGNCVGAGGTPCVIQTDCHGDIGGSAYTDDCNKCVGGNTGLTACIPCSNTTPFDPNSATITPGATPAPFTNGVYGITDAKSMENSISACSDGSNWKAVLTTLKGNYFEVVRLLPGQEEVTGIGGNTTESNYCAQVTDLKDLGYSSSTHWYMINAVQAHEDVHASRLLPALIQVTPDIISLVSSLSVPMTGQTEDEAKSQIMALPEFRTTLNQAFAKWEDEYIILITNDHTSGGPTDQAEHAVVDPMRANICTYATTNSWPTCSACP